MKVTLEQLKKLFSTYRLKVLRVQPIDDGFIVQTNKGTKAVTIWESGDLLQWSNRWREEAALHGGAGVERFLTNANRKKYIRYQGKYFVISDIPGGQQPDLRQAEECLRTGETFAQYHLALERIEQGSIALVNHNTVAEENIFTNAAELIKQQMKNIEAKEQPTIIDEMIYINLPLIYKRFYRAYQLWLGIKDAIPYFPLSTVNYQLEQITKSEGEWYINGGYNQPLAPIHQDTVNLIRQVYEKSEWNQQAVENLLIGYEGKRKLNRNERSYILMQLAVPIEVWTHLLEYFKHGNLTEEQSGRIIESIKRQKYWDDLALSVAKRMDGIMA